MSGSGEDEVFDSGASPDLHRTPELRRSTRTSAKKRSSTGALPYTRPRSKKKMQTVRSPQGTAPVPQTSGPAPPNAGVQDTADVNPFSSLGQQPGPGADILSKMQEMMGGMLGGMETRLNKATNDLRSSVSGQIGQVAATVTDLGCRVSATERRMDEIEQMVERKIEEGFQRASLPMTAASAQPEEFPCLPGPQSLLLSSSSGSGSGASSCATALTSSIAVQPRQNVADRQERDYWNCRRSLRLRPVDGPDVKEAALSFFGERLKMDSATIRSLGDFHAEFVPHGPETKYKKEVLVRFATVEARDIVRGSAPNLAGNGPEVGVGLEIPNNLRSAMKALQSLSFELKQKHPGARRNVLFDDDVLRLVLDFSLGEGKPWRRVTADQARRRIKDSPISGFRVDEDELADILGPRTE